MTFQVYDVVTDGMKDMTQDDLDWLTFAQQELGKIVAVMRNEAKADRLSTKLAFALCRFEEAHSNRRVNQGFSPHSPGYVSRQYVSLGNNFKHP